MAVFDAKKKKGDDKVLPVSLNHATKEHLIDLAFFYGVKQTPALVRICEELVGDTDLQKQFRAYAQASERIPADRKATSHSSISTTFVIPTDLFESLHNLRVELRILEISFFIRTIINFFYDNRIAVKDNQKLDKFRKKIEKDLDIDYLGLFEGKIVFFGDYKPRE